MSFAFADPFEVEFDPRAASNVAFEALLWVEFAGKLLYSAYFYSIPAACTLLRSARAKILNFIPKFD